MNIGIIGLGAMGSAIAKNLAAAGHTVCSWSRSDLAVEGVTAVSSVEQTLQGDIAISLLSDDAAIQDVLIDDNLLRAANSSLVHIIASTISVKYSHALTRYHEDAGIAYVAAPVLGRPDVAALGELNVLAAGPQEALDYVMPVLDIISKRVWHMGEAPAAAYAAKIACNMMITMAIEAMAEAVVLTESNGLERERFFDLILNTLFGSRSYQIYSRNIVQESYEPGFKATLGLKDLRLAREAAADSSAELPMLAAVHHQMHSAVDAGDGEKDWSVLADFTLRSAKIRSS